MSWFFGVVHRQSADIESQLRVIRNKSRGGGGFHFENFEFYFGGAAKNFLSYSNADSSQAWAVSGIPLKSTEQGTRECSVEDWHTMLKSGVLDCDGHYCGFELLDKMLVLFTDPLGVRDIHVLQLPEAVIFSTRIDLLAPFAPLKINFEVFGSTWLCANNFSSESIYSPLIRVTNGARAVVHLPDLHYQIEKNDWLRKQFLSENTSAVFEDEIQKFLFVGQRETVLGLSGGLDSRMLLSLLMSKGSGSWAVHTSGPSKDLDCLLAGKIAADLNIPLYRFLPEEHSAAVSLDALHEFCFQTRVNHPISSFFSLQILTALEKMDCLFIDGGFGEIWRREYFNRLLLTGRNAVLSEDANAVAAKIISTKADIFVREVNEEMTVGCAKQFERLFAELPSPKTIGIENWLDAAVLKTRLPNYFGVEQARIDERISCIMPYAQPSVLAALFRMRVDEKKNGGLFKRIIRSNCRALIGYGLVKGELTLPFRASTLETRLRMFMHKRFRTRQPQKSPSLNALQEYVLDTVSSAHFLQTPYYNHRRVTNMAHGYFLRDETAHRAELEWWLTFEMNRAHLKEINAQ